MKTIEGLYNDRQRAFYLDLVKGHTPSFVGNIYGIEHHQLIDFLQALSILSIDEPTTNQRHRAIYSALREQFSSQTTEQISSFMGASLGMFNSSQADGYALLLPYQTENIKDVTHAAIVINKILDTQFLEDLRSVDFQSFFLTIVMMMSLHNTITTWPAMTRGVRFGNNACSRALGRFIGAMNLRYRYPIFRGYKHPHWKGMADGDPGEYFNQLYASISKIGDALNRDTNIIPVDDDSSHACNKLLESLAGNSNELKQAVKIVAWFGAYEDYFQEIAAEMWDEIHNKPKYWMVPGGRDLVKIDIPAFTKVGSRYIQLIPEKEFPCFTGRLWIYLNETIDPGARVFVDYHIEPGPLTQGRPDFDPKCYSSLEDKMRKFMMVQCAWRLATGKTFKAKPKRTATGERVRKEIEESFVVRPHFRNLPPTYRASLEAIAKSERVWQLSPPKNKTFVMSDPDGTNPQFHTVMSHEFETTVRPVIRYTLNDLDYTEG
jgi:hypothetical protein